MTCSLVPVSFALSLRTKSAKLVMEHSGGHTAGSLGQPRSQYFLCLLSKLFYTNKPCWWCSRILTARTVVLTWQ